MPDVVAERSRAKPTLSQVSEFLYREAWLIDERRFEEWLALFDEAGEYWVPALWNQPDPLDHVSLFYEDRDLLAMRVRRLRHAHTTAQKPASRTCHQVGNIMLDQVDPATGLVTVRSNLLLVEYRRMEQRIFAGLCRHTLKPVGDELRILRKRVDLLNCDSDAGHLRINVPF